MVTGPGTCGSIVPSIGRSSPASARNSVLLPAPLGPSTASVWRCRSSSDSTRNSKALAAGLRERGFDLVSGGTDNHLAVIDMTQKKVFGRKTAQALNKAGIVANYNTIPFDPRRPFNPSGVRIGTPSVTSRGMREPEMDRIAAYFDTVVASVDDEEKLAALAREVAEFCKPFAAPGLPFE